MPPPLPPASAPPANGQAGRGPGGAPPARRNGGFGFVAIAGVGMALLAALIGVWVCNSRASSKYNRAREPRQQWRVTAKAATTAKTTCGAPRNSCHRGVARWPLYCTLVRRSSSAAEQLSLFHPPLV